eukprot:m.307441 g.307441  ORF g.307441 m.307441 type:complete len:870 (+) comp16362_c0_seq1:778-3387(+)
MVRLQPFSQYSLRVRYRSATGQLSGWSDRVNDTTLQGPQLAPQVSQTQSPNNTHIRVAWDVGHVFGVITRTVIVAYDEQLTELQTFTCNATCRSFDLEFVRFVTVRVDNTAGNGSASFPLRLNRNLVAESTAQDSDERTTVAALITVAVIAVVLMLVVVIIVRTRHETRRKAMRPADYREIIERLQRAAIEAGHDVQFRREEAAVPLRRASVPDHDAVEGSASDATGERGIRHFDMPPELNRKDVVLERCIGSGQFGEVHVGQLKTTIGRVRGSVAVAVKMARSEEHALPLIEEGVVTWLFMHPNIIQMHGAVTKGLPKLLVLEYCGNGSLIEWLQVAEAVRETGELLLIMHGISAGMKYLASRRFVHRDLAARNILLGDDMTPKIADFGLSRCFDTSEYYRVATERMLPVRWTDPYAVETDVFSEMTDVWSFGVLAIELFSKGARPYGAWSNLLVLESTRNGFRLHKPFQMPNEVYDHIVFPCWASSETPETALPTSMLGAPTHSGEPKVHSYACRPSFDELHQRLGVLCVEYQQRVLFAASTDAPKEARAPSWNDAGQSSDLRTRSVDGIGTDTDKEVQGLYELRHQKHLTNPTGKSRSGSGPRVGSDPAQWAVVSPITPLGDDQVAYRIHSSASSGLGGSALASGVHPSSGDTTAARAGSAASESARSLIDMTTTPPSPLVEPGPEQPGLEVTQLPYAHISIGGVASPKAPPTTIVRPCDGASSDHPSPLYAHTQLSAGSGVRVPPAHTPSRTAGPQQGDNTAAQSRCTHTLGWMVGTVQVRPREAKLRRQRGDRRHLRVSSRTHTALLVQGGHSGCPTGVDRRLQWGSQLRGLRLRQYILTGPAGVMATNLRHSPQLRHTLPSAL